MPEDTGSIERALATLMSQVAGLQNGNLQGDIHRHIEVIRNDFERKHEENQRNYMQMLAQITSTMIRVETLDKAIADHAEALKALLNWKAVTTGGWVVICAVAAAIGSIGGGLLMEWIKGGIK